ncbi:MAG: ornithine carbamoyltransferase [Firmicutes bacterium]|nr:ornithine carbamoyltransferase [Bacillota bacterium]
MALARGKTHTPLPAAADLRGRDLLELDDLGPTGVRALLDLARHLRTTRAADVRHALEGRVVALFFRKASTRTRVTFESAAARLGATSLFLREGDIQIARGESIEDTARVLSGYVDAIVVRTYAHAEVERWAAAADVPVVNALTDLAHPTQVVADWLTLEDRFGQLGGLAAAYVGDGNNMANSYLVGAALCGMDLRVATPPGYEPDAGALALARRLAAATGARLTVGHDPHAAVAGARAVITDVWASMGQEQEAEARRQVFAPYAVTPELFARAAQDAVFLHCLPAHRGEEVAAEVIDGPRSLVLPEAHNRLWVEAAILLALLGEEDGDVG